MFKMKAPAKVSERNFTEEMVRLFKSEIDNFFDRKAYFDFRHLNLEKLDVELLSSRASQVRYEDNVQEKFANFFKHNNELIIENFQIDIAKKFSSQALHQSLTMYIPEDKMELALLEFLGQRRTDKWFPLVLKDEFINNIMRLKLPQLDLTMDEYELLFYLIWKKFDFGEFSLRSITKWILEFRTKRQKELIKVYSQEQGGKQFSTQLEVPEIFKQIVKVSKMYGFSFLRSAFQPFLDSSRKMDMDNLKILLQSLEISFDYGQLNEFKYFCAHQNILSLKDPTKSMAKVQIDEEKFLKEIETQMIDIFGDEKQQKYPEYEDEHATQLDKAYFSFFQSVVSTTLKKIMKKLEIYQDENKMIDEVRLRRCISEEVSDLNHELFGHIILSLKNSNEPTIYNPLRRIYVPEFYQQFEQRLIFNLKLPKSKANALLAKDKKLEDQDEEYYDGLKLKGFQKIDQNSKNSDDKGILAPKEGRFVNPPDKAFAVQIPDDKKIMEKLQNKLMDLFLSVKMEQESFYKKIEYSILGFYNHLKQFDPMNQGIIDRQTFYDILFKLLDGFKWEELYYIIDFAVNVSKVEDERQKDQLISYGYFCVQITKYYQLNQLFNLKNMN